MMTKRKSLRDAYTATLERMNVQKGSGSTLVRRGSSDADIALRATAYNRFGYALVVEGGSTGMGTSNVSVIEIVLGCPPRLVKAEAPRSRSALFASLPKSASSIALLYRIQQFTPENRRSLLDLQCAVSHYSLATRFINDSLSRICFSLPRTTSLEGG